MWGIGLEEIILVIIVYQYGESAIVSSSICTRVFLKLELGFSSDREEFLFEMYILLSLVLFGPWGRGEKVENKWNNKSSDMIFWDVPHLGYLVWLVVDSNNFSLFQPGTFHSQCDCVCEDRVRYVPLPLLPVDFSQALVHWDFPHLQDSLFLCLNSCLFYVWFMKIP